MTLALMLAGALIAQTTAPVVEIHRGKHWVWYARQDHHQQYRADIDALYEYADKAYDTLVEAWGVKPPADRYSLLVMERTGGGFAAGDISEVRAITGRRSPGIGVAYNAFPGSANGIKSYWAYVLITHEMVNLFTGEAVSGGWPVDWWANHRSPFPLMTALQIEYTLRPDVAVHHARQGMTDPLVVMFLRLKDQYGWHMFRTAFRTAVADGVRWDRIGSNPSALLTNYVAAYLQLGAPESIWSHLATQVPGFDAKIAADVVRARQRWRTLPEAAADRARLRAAFLRGDYEECLKD